MSRVACESYLNKALTKKKTGCATWEPVKATGTGRPCHSHGHQSPGLQQKNPKVANSFQLNSDFVSVYAWTKKQWGTN